jgi:heme exporter protein D
MRMNLGPHAIFIVSSYVVVVVVVVALIGWIVADYAAQRRILSDLEQRGVTRRSQRARDDTP